MKRFLIIISLVLVLNTTLPAQARNDNPLKNLQNGIGTQFSTGYLMNILPISNFTMHHQLSSTFVSGGGQSLMMNTYMNSMVFNFKFPLLVKLDLGFASSPLASSSDNNDLKNQLFGQLYLQYKPTNNLMFGLSVTKNPGIYYPYGTYPMYYNPASYFNEN